MYDKAEYLLDFKKFNICLIKQARIYKIGLWLSIVTRVQGVMGVYVCIPCV